MPFASSALSGIGSSIFLAVFGKLFASVAAFSMWFAAESVGIHTIFAPMLIAWLTACGLMPPLALLSAMPEKSFTPVSGKSFSRIMACETPR